MPLKEYNRKRNFKRTSEPSGKKSRKLSQHLIFVVQQHAASHLHYDFRLELNGVLLSWAVPKGPSLDPANKRLAVHVEDHPLNYATFEGIIPQNEYGGGTVMVWDIGYWQPVDDDAKKSYQTGKLKFELFGKKLRGIWELVRLRKTEKGWLLIKKADKFSSTQIDILKKAKLSALTDRSIVEIKQATDAVHTRKQTKKSNNQLTISQLHQLLAINIPSVKQSTKLDTRIIKPLKGAKKSARLPNFIQPELTTATEAPSGDNWLHEMKLDGYRIITIINAKKIRLMTRGKQDWTEKFSAIATALKQFPFTNTILDGELVALDKKGLSQFQLLQNVLEYNKKINLYYYIFDIVYCGGYDLSRVRLIERKNLLKHILDHWPDKPDIIRYSDHIEGDGAKVFQTACELGMEGIVSKRADSFYQQRRSHDWTKTKCSHRQEFVIGGYTDPERSRQYFGSLLLGYYDNKKHFIYCGHVGIGFDQDTLKSFSETFEKLHQIKSPFYNSPNVKNTCWVKPQLVIEVEFREWTQDGLLRQASFQGLRRDKNPKDVHREEIMEIPRRSSTKKIAKNSNTQDLSTLANVSLSHPEKLLYSQPNITKFDLATFYKKIADWILPHVINRPLTLLRCPEGIDQKCFYQKHSNEKVPKGMGAVRIKNGEPDYLFIKDLTGLIGLVQWDVLEIHPWGSKTKTPQNPDRIIFDLDPDENTQWKDIIKTAFLLRDNLQSIGLESFVKTSGGKGLHIVVPLTGKHTWEQVKQFSRSVAEVMVQQKPMLYTATMSKAKRHNKIFIDYLRNAEGATAVAAYSVRARQNAPVSTPITWQELKTLKSPAQFNVKNFLSRLNKLKQDPWKGFFQVQQKLKLK